MKNIHSLDHGTIYYKLRGFKIVGQFLHIITADNFLLFSYLKIMGEIRILKPKVLLIDAFSPV